MHILFVLLLLVGFMPTSMAQSADDENEIYLKINPFTSEALEIEQLRKKLERLKIEQEINALQSETEELSNQADLAYEVRAIQSRLQKIEEDLLILRQKLIDGEIEQEVLLNNFLENQAANPPTDVAEQTLPIESPSVSKAVTDTAIESEDKADTLQNYSGIVDFGGGLRVIIYDDNAEMVLLRIGDTLPATGQVITDITPDSVYAVNGKIKQAASIQSNTDH